MSNPLVKVSIYTGTQVVSTTIDRNDRAAYDRLRDIQNAADRNGTRLTTALGEFLFLPQAVVHLPGPGAIPDSLPVPVSASPVAQPSVLEGPAPVVPAKLAPPQAKR